MNCFKSEPSHWVRMCECKIESIDKLFIKSKKNSKTFYRRMFDEDFARIFRSKSRRENDLFEILTNDEKITQNLLGSIKTRYRPRQIQEVILRLVEEIAQQLIWGEKAFYYLYENLDEETFHIVPLSSVGVICLFGAEIQWVPKRIENYFDRDDKELPREIRILDSAKIMRFKIPSSIKRILSAQNKVLAMIDKYQYEPRNFHPQPTHLNPHPTIYFDFQAWKDTQDRILYRATRRTGWNCRKSDSSKRSDFFVCHRMIRFRRNQIMLVEDILHQLSSQLTSIGKTFKSDFSIKIASANVAPSVEHLNSLEKKLEKEEVNFSEIVDYFYNL